MIDRARMVASAAEALDLAVERLVEREPDLPLATLARRLSSYCEDVLVDYDADVAREALYLLLGLRIVKERRTTLAPATR